MPSVECVRAESINMDAFVDQFHSRHDSRRGENLYITLGEADFCGGRIFAFWGDRRAPVKTLTGQS